MQEKSLHIFLDGRTGNQLFQLCFLKYLEQKGFGKGEISSYGSWGNCVNGFRIEYVARDGERQSKIALRERLFFRYLENRFPFSENKGSQAKDIKYARMLRKLGFIVNRTSRFYIEKRPFFKHIYIKGAFENPIYPLAVEKWARECFVARKMSEKASHFMHQIQSIKNSVCISVRRGDYFSEAYIKTRGICREGYFKRGIEKILSLTNNQASFVVFSDEPNWCKSHMCFPNGTLFEEEGALSLAEKMTCMAACEHFIISNSTFSWWAQFLGSSKDKIVIAPHKWNAQSDSDYIQKMSNWILVPCDE